MKKVIREVSFTNMNGFDGYQITSTDGELDVFYPVKIHPATHAGCCDTVEVSEEFFTRLQMLSGNGVQIVFKR